MEASREGRVLLLLAITLLTLQVGWMVKSQCFEMQWDGSQWRNYCYSDVQALHGTRGAGDGTWPYTETFNEYPVLIGTFMHIVGESTDTRAHYMLASAVGLGALALVVTWLLAQLVPGRQVLYWAVAPALMLYALYNWDLLAIAPAIGALWAFEKGRPGLAGALLGVGACAKLYPAFMAPALGLALLRRDAGLRRDGWAFGLAFLAIVVAFHLPFLLINAELTLEAYRFQAQRSPNFETFWYSMAHVGREWGWAWMDWFDEEWFYQPASLLAFLAALGVSGWASWTKRLPPVAAACIPVFAFLAFNKVLSMQYTLWAIPLIILCPLPRTLKALVVVADLAVFVSLSQYFALSGALQDGHLFTPAALAAIFRTGVYAAVAWHLTRLAWTAAPAASTPLATGAAA